jgi:hypothetical protein
MNEETEVSYATEEQVEAGEAQLERDIEDMEADPVAEEVAKEVAPETKRGIKETKEVLEALNVLAEFFARMFADGQVNSSDFIHVVGLMKNLDTFGSAIGGFREVDDELKDLDEAELIELGLAAYGLVKKVVSAVKK